ncbi:hypothetical protein PCC7418_0502 [Halothece sp. PCC 7418]|uniref:hypothetical protein n=1 Tax=Halothece sp. (strain PCC 7418) TaxID=65093 RepID=UPI0002A0658D|nr:hypothetical protein [Halothece sp. PCC 7418]AFZ42731.1 hypothetical protein PCC7418_0502 [Halothece sp. PCC 7418]
MTLSHPPRRLESDAELMINTLFSEVDQALQKNRRFEHLQSREHHDHSQQGNPVSGTPFSGGYNEDDPENFAFRDDPLHDVNFDPLEEFEQEFSEPPPPQSPFWTRHLDKIIFFSSCSLFMGSLLLIEDDHQFSLASLQEIQAAMADSEPEEPQITDTNPEFLNYMERALVEIDREQALAEKLKAQQKIDQAQPPVTPIIPETKPQPTPVSQPQKPQSVATLPALPPPPPALAKANPPTPTPSPQPQPAKTQQSENQTVTPTQPPAPSTDSQPQTPKTTPEISPHRLVGLLELGEHSAALLKVQGATQRIMLEETIPGSNWKLVSVANQKATFRNHEQQKVMFVGEEMSVQ